MTILYKGSKQCTADRFQVPAMEKAGWSTKKEPVVVPEPVKESVKEPVEVKATVEFKPTPKKSIVVKEPVKQTVKVKETVEFKPTSKAVSKPKVSRRRSTTKK